MTFNGWLQITVYLVVLLLLVKPLGSYMARVFQGEHTILDPVLGPVERLTYRLSGVDPREEMDWKVYAMVMLLFSAVCVIFVYVLQRLQGFLPLNPQGLGAVDPALAFNTAISFATNTNWQNYGGETTLTYLTQRDLIRLYLHGQQQRQRLCGPRDEQSLLQPHRRGRHGHRALLAGGAYPRIGWGAGA